MEEEDYRMVVGLAYRENSNLLLQFPESKHYWLSKEQCHWTKTSERIRLIRSEKACPLIALSKTQKEKPLTCMVEKRKKAI